MKPKKYNFSRRTLEWRIKSEVMKGKLYILIGLLLGTSLVAETSISSSVSDNDITIGDQITYTIDILYPEGSTLITPPVAANLGMFEIRDFSVDDTKDDESGQIKQSMSYILSTFTTGEYTIPPLPIAVFNPDSTIDTLFTQPIEVNVKSLLEGKNPEELDIRGIKAPLEYPSDNRWIWWLSGGLLLVLAALVLLWYYIRKKKQGIGLFDFSAPPKPAHEIAMEKLIALEYTKYLTFEEAKAYFTELSETLREYIENGLDVTALEMTTFETLEGMKDKDISGRKIVEEILTEADMVKFAKRMPEEKIGDALRKKAIEFVKLTMPVLVQKEEEQGGENS